MDLDTALILFIGAPSLILITYSLIIPAAKTLRLGQIITFTILWLVWKFPSLAIIYTLSKMVEKKPTETILLLGGASYLKKDNVVKEKIKQYVEKNMKDYE